MTSSTQTIQTSPHIGAKAASVILLATLVAYIFADYFLLNLLEYIQGLDGPYSLRAKTDNELKALRSAITGVLNPAIIAVVSLLLLKWYLPNETIASFGQRVGMVGKPPPIIFFASFACGLIYFAFFVVLKQLFPPGEFVTPHPDHVINYGSFGEKLIFAVTAFTLVPVAEEILFRGILYQGFAHSYGKLVSTACVSSVFILLHPASIESGYWVTHMTLYLIPFFLIALREVTGTLYAPIAAHSGFNFSEVFF